MEKILVTGGSGFIGSYLVRRLITEGYSVRIFDNGFRGNLHRLLDLAGDFELQTGDIRNPEAVDQACQGVDTIFHLACINGTKYFYEIPETVLEVAVRGTLNTLESAGRHHVARYFLASSSEVYQEPAVIPTPETERATIPDVKNPRYSYAGGKLIGELLTLHYGGKLGLETVIFRPHNIYGPNMGREHVIPEFILRISELSKSSRDGLIDLPLQGSGLETRAFCYIDDMIDGLMTLFHSESGEEIFHIGNDREEIAIIDLAEKIAASMRIRLNITHTPLRSGGTPRRCPDIQRLRSLGYEPKVPLDEGLAKTIEWYITQ
ncbi:MAG TPA: NAD-dependent epimerase/dehydratase family protein [Bacillota bacterium]|nr:NAD-dependent epimerase/dehydratase family protein [Bacillota bacterium]